MGDANLNYPLAFPAPVCQSAETQASVRVGVNLCAAMMRLEPLEAKVLFTICYHYAQTGSGLEASLSEIAALVNTTKDKARHAIRNLTLSHEIRTDVARNSHGLLPREDYLITLELNESRTKPARKAHAKKAEVSSDSGAKVAPFDDPESLIRLLPEELESLIRKFGDVQACFLIDQLDDYLKANPKKKYSSHYLTMLNWDRMAREKGKKFVAQHPQLGTGYFPLHTIERSR